MHFPHRASLGVPSTPHKLVLAKASQRYCKAPSLQDCSNLFPKPAIGLLVAMVSIASDVLFLTRISFAACFNRGRQYAACSTLPRLSVSPHPPLLKTFISTHIALAIEPLLSFLDTVIFSGGAIGLSARRNKCR